MPYVNQRWLGGMLTNFQTVNKRLQRLKELEQVDFDDVAGSSFTKKELLIMRRERDKLAKTLGGIRDMARVPSAVWIVDTNKEHLAVDEARKLNIPIVAILDTNCDPDVVDYKIPGNDDAIRAVTLLTRVIADAVAEGLMQRHSGRASSSAEAEEPLAEWERELLAGSEGELASSSLAEGEPASSSVAEGEPVAAEAPVDTAPAAESAEPVVATPQALAPEVRDDLTEAAPGTPGPADVATPPGNDAAPAVDAAAAGAAPEIAAAGQGDADKA
jgi:small subunit ribosomal protein S2